MTNKNKITPLILLVVTAVGIPYLIFSTSQISRSRAQKNPLEGVSDRKENFPEVDYMSNLTPDADRRAKSEKYGKVEVLDPTIESDEEEVAHLDWEVGLTALPVEKSAVIVKGKVVKATAYLSSNKASVYSEFEIEIQQIFKNSDRNSLKDKFIYIQRQGGIVRFPSGFEKWFHVNGQRMPVLGETYLFFLTHDFLNLGMDKKNYHLLTAYLLRDGKVKCLDDLDAGHPLNTVYNQRSLSVLLSDPAGFNKSLK